MPAVDPQIKQTVASAMPTAVVNAGSQLAMESAKLGADKQVIEPVLVGHSEQIKRVAKSIAWDLTAVRVVHAPDEAKAAEAAVALARNGEVQSLMKGDVHTDALLKAVINKETGLRTGQRLSHVFRMLRTDIDASICITDAVINVAPTVDTKLDIARNAVALLHALGNPCPKVAVLSATEVPTQAMPSSIEAQEVAKAAMNGAVENAIVDGPLAFDNAVSEKAAKIKSINSPVAGHADVLLVPNIETGNALFKQMVYYMNAIPAGVVLGAKVPVMLTSRADNVKARLASMELAAEFVAA